MDSQCNPNGYLDDFDVISKPCQPDRGRSKPRSQGPGRKTEDPGNEVATEPGCMLHCQNNWNEGPVARLSGNFCNYSLCNS